MQSAFQELYLSFVLIAVNESHGGMAALPIYIMKSILTIQTLNFNIY